MAAIIPFVPSAVQAPEFLVTLDNQTYRVLVTWSLAGQRYYINIYNLDGTLIVCRALVGSPVGSDIASMSWTNGTVTVETKEAHGLMLYSMARITIAGVAPAAYNGQQEVFVTGRYTFTYPLAANPGEVVTQGSASQNLNMVDGYFTTSTLVFRTANSQFEVGP